MANITLTLEEYQDILDRLEDLETRISNDENTDDELNIEEDDDII